MEQSKIVKVAKDIYWVGGSGHKGGLHCNPYLLVDGDEAILFDPGSVLDFDYVYDNICELIPLEKVKYVVLHHQDPDLCSSVPLFEQKGAKFKVVTHWRTATLVKYYGIKSDYYIVNEHGFELELSSGKTLKFIQTPYLHFPGAIVTYDYDSKVLFSSDLFGAFSHEWSLFAKEDYIEKMKTFHEHYMPSNDIIRPVMEIFLRMDIDLIAPQHGSIIKEHITEHIKVLRDLDCGAFMLPIKKDLAKSGGFRSIGSAVLKRYASIFKKEEVLEVVQDMDIDLDKETMEIIDYNYTGNTLWNMIFERALAIKGIQWLIVVEPLVHKIAEEYDISMPQIFNLALTKVKEESITLSEENKVLKEANERLQHSMKEAQEKLIKCPVTGLYNYEFFKNYFEAEVSNLILQESEQNPALIIISLDNMAKIRYSYGDNEVDEVLKTALYIINSMKDENMILFRLQGAMFACYSPHTTKEYVRVFAEKLRNLIASSVKFIEKLTVSIGVLCLDELKEQNEYIGDPSEMMYNVAMMRVKLAKSMGMNIVCSSSSVVSYQEEIGKILIIDTDPVNMDVLKVFLENLNFKVITARDGEEALSIAERETLDLIISEIMIPKLDGFLVRENLLAHSQTKNIPFILISHLKNDDSVNRASSLMIEHYLKKPFMLSELLGIIKNKFKGED
ncbi:MAG: diguanylate cyclase protein [Clostridia bacterium]|jgi:diguanylate cyclase (GGDEF)-like protein|nr:diguanylate cyclase protein [Clostridia bacterium]